MPRLGLTMTEAKIIEWLKGDGDWVEKGDILFVIENEKSTVEIEAPTDGRLRILLPIDVTVPILTPVAILTGGTVGGHHAATDGGSSAPHSRLNPPRWHPPAASRHLTTPNLTRSSPAPKRAASPRS
jgi:pyruvate/2-oxoglutarate dehydrogenase complex dihydrolipoamide acyltransferase (E2) component